MPPEVDVATDPMLVYGLVGVFVGAVILALFFARPRPGLGAIKPSDVPASPAGGPPWMPGGDVFGSEPTVHDPWSSRATDENV
jgi:hypothetical protein